MSTRRTRRTAAASEVAEEVAVVETRTSKRTRAGTRKAATTTATSTKVTKSTAKAKRATTPTADNTPKTRVNAQTATRQNAVASTPAAPATGKRRLRSTNTESASPLRALDEQPPKRQRAASRKSSARSAPAKSESSQDEDEDEETPIFFTKKFDSFDVEDPDTKPAFMTGDESALALLRHVQEAARSPRPIEASVASAPTPSATKQTTPSSPPKDVAQNTSTPSRSIFASFTTPFTALKNLFGSPAAASPPSSPTPFRPPPPGSMTEVLTIPPTPIGERAKRSSKKASRKPNRFVKALLQGVTQDDVAKATAWAETVAAELQKDSAAGEKRKRLETPVFFRDLEHFPASKPWQTGFSFPDDVLDLEDDDIVPAWAVYTSMVEEEHRRTKKNKLVHATSIDDDMPASLNETFSMSTSSTLDLHPRRSIDPSPMFDTPLHHKEGDNIFTELNGHDAVANDRENLQRELKAGGSQLQKKVEISTAKPSTGLHKAHDPAHGSFSVPDSDSDSDEEEVSNASPVWTQAPPPPPTPSHTKLPNTSQVEAQRQKLMKHTPHKPSRLQQVSYPSPSVISDAGGSPMKLFEDDVPTAEPLVFGDAVLDAAVAALEHSEGLQAKLSAMRWSTPVMVYDSEEEELSPI